MEAGNGNDYEADRDDCRYRGVSSLTAYSYGCRCIGCRKSRAANRERSKQGLLLCNAPGCEKPRRRVQGAGYCEEHATSVHYGPGRGAGFRPITCAHCGRQGRVRRTTVYPICLECRKEHAGIVARAQAHGVDLDRLIGWMRDPRCDLCDRTLYTGKGKGGACGFNIDHDHSHCDALTGCPECVRGLTCGRCNNCLGGVETLLRVAGAERIFSYLGSVTGGSEVALQHFPMEADSPTDLVA
jgi:hypothetical protein